eukprot:SAG11_NODE_24013_length_379_cov_0.910714_1_plen_95_part_01
MPADDPRPAELIGHFLSGSTPAGHGSPGTDTFRDSGSSEDDSYDPMASDPMAFASVRGGRSQRPIDSLAAGNLRAGLFGRRSVPVASDAEQPPPL